METRIKSEVEEATLGEEAAQAEGPVARAIESKTARLPSDLFLWGSLASICVSLALQLSQKKGNKQASSFIGQWAPTLLILGLYNKLVKVAGHDRASS